MASPPSQPSPVSQPTPLQSPISPELPLHHPTPDLQSLQGAYISNIERLEDRAERMSEAGSDLGEEIRKLQLGQKLAESRRSSLRSAERSEDATKLVSGRSRNASVSSYANSIVDVNTAARWGGYSPGGYVTSPGGSVVSSAPLPTTSHPPLQRQRSESRASRLGQMVHMDQHEEEPHSPVEGPASPRSYISAPRSVAQSHGSLSSFTQKYDQIAQEIRKEMDEGFSTEAHGEGQKDPSYFPHIIPDPELPDRPPTAASTDTYQQARGLWQDFDGAHCPDTVPEEDPSQLSPNGSRNSSLPKPAPQPLLQPPPPPEDGMVFYPAPVPQTLNLPKRLSRLPPANIQAKRRTQLLEAMQTENRKSAHLSNTGIESTLPNRKSRQSLANIPPQLRASAFFDRVAPIQEFEVKGESAEQTLDSILEASTHAPVSAFTDHPIVGDVGKEVYAPERKAKRVSKAVEVDKSDARKSRSSLNLLDTRRNSSGDPLNKLKKRNSSADLHMLTVRASESRMSLADELDDPRSDARGPEPGDDTNPTGRFLNGDDGGQSDRDVDETSNGEDEEPHYFGPPTTLLAELQMRKEQQKSRNLTAVKLSNGLRSTLLELDAVREIEKKKRMTQKVHLAWEAPSQLGADEEDSDEDVPLGVLYPGRGELQNKKLRASQHVSDWDRPLGLLAQRELEDTEPLSKRRTRLIISDPSKRRTQMPEISQSQQYLAVPTRGDLQPESEEDEEETLAQRLRRLKQRQALDDALDPGVRKSTVSGEFAAEMLSTLGVQDSEKPKPSPSPDDEGEEETLGQRRARLQAEALARGETNPLSGRPPLRGSMSLGNILAAHPVDDSITPRKTSDEVLMSSLAPGSLLHQDAARRSRKDAERIERNNRISSYGTIDHPLVSDATKAVPEQTIAANIQAYKDKLTGVNSKPPGSRGTIPSMVFSPTMPNPNLPGMGMGMGMGMAPPYATGGMGIRPVSGFVYPGNGISPLQQQQMMAMNMNMSMMGMPASPYQQMGGGGMDWRQSSMMNLPMAAPSPMQMQMQAAMDQKQRDMIDQWRNGVM
ncbi:uncharacterized protein EI97DRAFT_437652 [Westerdykella ornata]|uniref:Uncharacterized protein n=1 Tax=Westerdykella ornata TaxID=318751 RepID=A0A6A6J4W1_WESOR|nr:uncharacterized protein EI97DRAFT_437652 [Westerdykella ornata]KAF2271611.1 hypothetical protein EI97DRAFT_437652 [Westerdykella ornata]